VCKKARLFVIVMAFLLHRSKGSCFQMLKIDQIPV
jgi:hypothetical protein